MELLICPICGEPLDRREKSFVCGHGHNFDIAKSGYVNLLMSNRANAVHGDDRRMLSSRRDFLDKGYYAPLLRALCETAERFCPERAAVLDAGCGECYYTAGIFERLSAAGAEPAVYGIDVSRDALAMGAKRSRALRRAVASVFSLPFPGGVFDAAFSVFAPFAAEEFLRVLKPGGVLVRVFPGRRHLWELKSAVYTKPYENEPENPPLPGFSLAEAKELRFAVALASNEDIRNLFDMTPYAHRTSPSDRAKLDALERLETTAEFHILTYKKFL